MSAFGGLFAGQAYLHRVSTHGDTVAAHLFEDLYAIRRSASFNSAVDEGAIAVNVQNTQQGVRARRGDGTLGEVVPSADVTRVPGFEVGRGPVATIEIGCEVKILMKAMIKQIDRVISDLTGQANTFRARGGRPICVGIVGINWAPQTTSYEGEGRAFTTDGRKHKHPATEAEEAERRLLERAAPSFDELVILRFVSANVPPFDFAWKGARQTQLDYQAAVARIARSYQERFTRSG